jgi:CBS domain-containing protein
MKTIKDYISKRAVITVQCNESVQAAANKMVEYKIGALPVLEGERLVGIFTERDIIGKIVAPGLEASTVKVQDVMTKNLLFASADDTPDSCSAKMTQANIRHLPVVEGEHLVGMLSIRDLLALDMTEKNETIEFLEQYLFTIPPGMQKKY